MRHWKEATPEPPVSSPLKEKLAVATLTSGAGLAVIEVSGALVSTLQLTLAGEESGLPAWSIALTSNLWLPSPRSAYCLTELQVSQSSESRRHSKEATPEPPASSAVKEKLATATLTSEAG